MAQASEGGHIELAMVYTTVQIGLARHGQGSPPMGTPVLQQCLRYCADKASLKLSDFQLHARYLVQAIFCRQTVTNHFTVSPNWSDNRSAILFLKPMTERSAFLSATGIKPFMPNCDLHLHECICLCTGCTFNSVQCAFQCPNVLHIQGWCAFTLHSAKI